ncbi:hypothetical protein [Lutibacter sp. TH_r2]|uniref:hypothetical protein n=1 Tax=Lutibacter sp. TH_r2 TaxID=3082083 RepID=UPI0029548BAE|nr:hypothetical protein [Lutibacter sp. TH_r2]
MERLRKKILLESILISYLIGLPIGLITILIVFSIPVTITGDGIITILIIEIYGKAIIGLILSFIIALGFAGRNAYENLLNENTLIKTSFKYSLKVNLIIWSVFMIITLFDNFKIESLSYLIFPIIAFIICVLLTTYTIGLLICFMIKKKIRLLIND